MQSINRTPYLFACALAGLLACNPTDPPGNSSTSSSGVDPTTSTTDFDPTTTGFELLCEPGIERCADATTREVCKPTGLAWEPEACGANQVCNEEANNVALCVGPCEKAADNPTSLGCDFLAIRMRSGNGEEEDLAEFYDALIVGNPDPKPATIQLYFTPDLSHQEAPEGDPVVLAPNEAQIFQLTNSTIKGYSTLRAGGIYRVKSDIPVIAYLHSPLKNTNSNDSSMLLPLKTLRNDYVIASYPGQVNVLKPEETSGRPSYFNVISLEDETTIEWFPRAATAGNDVPVQKVGPGEKGSLTINRLDLMQIGASALLDMQWATHDVSGTIVRADKPIWVIGGTSCARVPYTSTGNCNHLQEQMIPIEYWGTKYVGAHSPLRSDQEEHYWRIYAGKPGVTVTTDPPQPGTPFTLAEVGQWKELIVKNGASFTFQGTDAFMPVQYLSSKDEADGFGDPAMYQTVPIEQFLKRYVFIPGLGYLDNYAQVVRVKDSAPVLINGLQYQVADVKLTVGDTPEIFVAESEKEFGVTIIGYTGITQGGSAYAYPGGMALKPITEL
jgi:hypothetical protein